MDKSRRWGGQILNYDGPPSRYLSDTLEPGVLQIGEPLLETEFKPTLFSAQVFAGFIGSATVESGRIDATPVGVDTPVVVSYRYDCQILARHSASTVRIVVKHEHSLPRPLLRADNRATCLDAKLLSWRSGRAVDLQ